MSLIVEEGSMYVKKEWAVGSMNDVSVDEMKHHRAILFNCLIF